MTYNIAFILANLIIIALSLVVSLKVIYPAASGAWFDGTKHKTLCNNLVILLGFMEIVAFAKTLIWVVDCIWK